MKTKFSLLLLFFSFYSGLIFSQTSTPTYCQNDVCTEYLPYKEVKLNGNIPIRMSVYEMIAKLGQPDSSYLDQGWDCGNYIDEAYEVTVYCYGKTQFISSNDKVLLHILNLEDDRFSLNYKGLKLEKGLKETDLEKHFPITYGNYKKHNRKHFVLQMSSPADHLDDSGWIFKLQDNSVTEIRFWWFIC